MFHALLFVLKNFSCILLYVSCLLHLHLLSRCSKGRCSGNTLCDVLILLLLLRCHLLFACSLKGSMSPPIRLDLLLPDLNHFSSPLRPTVVLIAIILNAVDFLKNVICDANRVDILLYNLFFASIWGQLKWDVAIRIRLRFLVLRISHVNWLFTISGCGWLRIILALLFMRWICWLILIHGRSSRLSKDLLLVENCVAELFRKYIIVHDLANSVTKEGKLAKFIYRGS